MTGGESRALLPGAGLPSSSQVPAQGPGRPHRSREHRRRTAGRRRPSSPSQRIGGGSGSWSGGSRRWVHDGRLAGHHRTRCVWSPSAAAERRTGRTNHWQPGAGASHPALSNVSPASSSNVPNAVRSERRRRTLPSPRRSAGRPGHVQRGAGRGIQVLPSRHDGLSDRRRATTSARVGWHDSVTVTPLGDSRRSER